MAGPIQNALHMLKSPKFHGQQVADFGQSGICDRILCLCLNVPCWAVWSLLCHL